MSTRRTAASATMEFYVREMAWQRLGRPARRHRAFHHDRPGQEGADPRSRAVDAPSDATWAGGRSSRPTRRRSTVLRVGPEQRPTEDRSVASSSTTGRTLSAVELIDVVAHLAGAAASPWRRSGRHRRVAVAEPLGGRRPVPRLLAPRGGRRAAPPPGRPGRGRRSSSPVWIRGSWSTPTRSRTWPPPALRSTKGGSPARPGGGAAHLGLDRARPRACCTPRPPWPTRPRSWPRSMIFATPTPC